MSHDDEFEPDELDGEEEGEEYDAEQDSELPERRELVEDCLRRMQRNY